MEVAVEIEKGQAGVWQEQVQLDFSDDSADDAVNNDKSKLDEDNSNDHHVRQQFQKNLIKLSNLVVVCDRCGVLNYSGVAITLATLVDYDIITKMNISQIIWPKKLGDQRRRCWEKRGEKQNLEI